MSLLNKYMLITLPAHPVRPSLFVCMSIRYPWLLIFFLLFLFYGPSTHFRSFQSQSVTLTTLHCSWASLLGRLPVLSAYLLPITDNWSSWIRGRGIMAVEISSWPSLHERMCWTWGSNSGPLACQRDMLPIGLLRPAISQFTVIFLSFRTDRYWQTVQTQIRLLLEEQSDQGPHCLQFPLHRLDALL